VRTLGLISRGLSLVIALFAVLVFEREAIPVYMDHWRNRHFVPGDAAVFVCPILFLATLALIWFGDSIAESAHDRGEWCPPLLVKAAGWVFLLALAVLICFRHALD